MRSITLKLILSFLVIGLISIFIIILLARQRHAGPNQPLHRVGNRGQDLVTGVANYHQTHCSCGMGEENHSAG